MVGGQRATAGGNGNTPLPTGQFSSSVTGSLAICVDPNTFALESCNTTGVLAVPYSFTALGYTTRDETGGCHARTELSSPLPPSAMPPIIDSEAHIPFKITHYDPTTGVGDLSFTTYDGGNCIGGAKFDSKRATITGSGTEHFAVSQGGTRIDGIITSLTGAPNSYIGSFILNGVDLAQ